MLRLLLLVSGVQRTRRMAKTRLPVAKTRSARILRPPWGLLGVWGPPMFSSCTTDGRSVSRPSLHLSPRSSLSPIAPFRGLPRGGVAVPLPPFVCDLLRVE